MVGYSRPGQVCGCDPVKPKVACRNSWGFCELSAEDYEVSACGRYPIPICSSSPSACYHMYIVLLRVGYTLAVTPTCQSRWTSSDQHMFNIWTIVCPNCWKDYGLIPFWKPSWNILVLLWSINSNQQFSLLPHMHMILCRLHSRSDTFLSVSLISSDRHMFSFLSPQPGLTWWGGIGITLL